MTAQEEMTKLTRLALEKALVGENAVEIADAIDTRIKALIFRHVTSAHDIDPPPSEKPKTGQQATCPRCLESIVYKSDLRSGYWCFAGRAGLHTDLACAERCAVNAEQSLEALYEIGRELGMSAQSDPPHVCVPRAVREHLMTDHVGVCGKLIFIAKHGESPKCALPTGHAGQCHARPQTIEVDGVAYGEHMIRELRERAHAAREKGVREALSVVETSGPDRPFEAMLHNLYDLLPGSGRR